MKNSLLVGTALTPLFLLNSGAWAQTQTGVIPGYMSPAGANGCPTTNACFVAYGSVVPVSGTITVSPIALQNVNVTQFGSAAIAQGATTAAHSMPVAIATDQTIAVTGTFTAPALQNVNITQVGSAAYALGSALSAASAPIVIASDQVAVATKAADGAIVTLGTTTGTVWSGSGTGDLLQVDKLTAQQVALLYGASQSAGLGTNLVNISGTTVLKGAGAVGTGAQRVAVAQDATTIGGSAPGTAGTASVNVLSIQGIASMTPVVVSGTVSTTGTSTIGGTVTLAAGAAIAGKFGIDQTTPGTTNGVVVNSGTVAVTQSGTWTGVTIVPSGTQTIAGTVTLAASTASIGSVIGDLDFGFVAGTSTALRAVATINGTAAVTLAAATAALHGYLTDVTCTRTDTGTLMAELTLNDAVSSTIPLPPTGGATIQRRVAFISNGTNTAITGTSTAGVTGHCDAAGYTGTWLLNDIPDQIQTPDMFQDLNQGRTSA